MQMILVKLILYVTEKCTQKIHCFFSWQNTQKFSSIQSIPPVIIGFMILLIVIINVRGGISFDELAAVLQIRIMTPNIQEYLSLKFKKKTEIKKFQILTLSRPCAEVIFQQCLTKVKVTLRGQSSKDNILCLLLISKTIEDLFMKFCPNINHHQTIRRE